MPFRADFHNFEIFCWMHLMYSFPQNMGNDTQIIQDHRKKEVYIKIQITVRFPTMNKKQFHIIDYIKKVLDSTIQHSLHSINELVYGGGFYNNKLVLSSLTFSILLYYNRPRIALLTRLPGVLPFNNQQLWITLFSFISMIILYREIWLNNNQIPKITRYWLNDIFEITNHTSLINIKFIYRTTCTKLRKGRVWWYKKCWFALISYISVQTFYWPNLYFFLPKLGENFIEVLSNNKKGGAKYTRESNSVGHVRVKGRVL